jgi:hypothetical protein
MSSIFVNGKVVTAEKYNELLKRKDIILHQLAPSHYITVTEADIYAHEELRYLRALIAPKTTDEVRSPPKKKKSED